MIIHVNLETNSFFKRKEDSTKKNNTLLGSNVKTLTSNKHSSESLRIELEEYSSRSSMVEPKKGGTWRDS